MPKSRLYGQDKILREMMDKRNKMLTLKLARQSYSIKRVLSGADDLSKMLKGGATGGISDVLKGTVKQALPEKTTSPAAASASGIGGLPQRHMENAIDKMVAASLMNGQQTTSVMRSFFGLTPSLIGR